ncbi:chorismate mutase [Tissierella carlieri]|jgi:chorismate mutase|uniref:chorismate mutase n=1 Tax=Tissierella carlieri TaxID=689904 RepID=A0ABT1S5D9_9FIRM|nr:chorismate mutase [Tissierella carlieri]MBU5311091.1 chorismate mutase [Tissierella carlieri]MCQ4921684.1 chorismate mutase [Tissierella carlieri]MDU5079982.1 chorismate mutase [Bacillota bacterium]
MNIVTIRGAITVPENSVSSILEGTRELLIEIEKENNIDRDKVISIIFSCTNDLDKVYPAKAARELGYINAGLMCFNEMYVKGSLDKCIRLMVLYNSIINQKEVKHIYLRDAKILRPDLSNNA